MNVLIIGGGGREHAIAWKLAASPLVDRLYCAPGNAGIAREAECIALDAADHDAVVAFCNAKAIDFVVIGPEGPLVAGLVDDLEAVGIKAFGPTKAAARLEGSKGFTKDLCRAHNIPTAAYQRCNTAAAARECVLRMGLPIVVKADGLAAGKGVVVAMSATEADSAIEAIFRDGDGDRSSDGKRAMDASGHPPSPTVRPPSSRNSWPARRRRFSFSPMATMRCLSRPPRITSAPSTAIAVRTPAAWAPVRRPP